MDGSRRFGALENWSLADGHPILRLVRIHGRHWTILWLGNDIIDCIYKTLSLSWRSCIHWRPLGIIPDDSAWRMIPQWLSGGNSTLMDVKSTPGHNTSASWWPWFLARFIDWTGNELVTSGWHQLIKGRPLVINRWVARRLIFLINPWNDEFGWWIDGWNKQQQQPDRLWIIREWMNRMNNGWIIHDEWVLFGWGRVGRRGGVNGSRDGQGDGRCSNHWIKASAEHPCSVGHPHKSIRLGELIQRINQRWSCVICF